MPLTDVFVVRYLLQKTSAQADSICWQELEAGGYEAQVSGVTVDLMQSQTRAGSYLCLILRAGSEKVYIAEPQNRSIFGVKYDDEDQRTLAELIRALADSVARQCAGRTRRSQDRGEELRQEIFQQLLFGERG
jgi:hypothetical protein